MYYDFDVAVIGGGASGLMAAAVAASLKKRVVIIEKNKVLGKKLSISGGGRCNITNNEEDLRVFLENYGKAKDFLFSPYSKFAVNETFKFFEGLGLRLVTQARKRVFPESEKAEDVTKTLETELKKEHVLIKTGVKVLKINTEADEITSITTSDGEITAKSYILATGGVSHPETGSTGDGFSFLKDLGHTIKDPTPTIVPLAASDQWIHALSGTSLSFMKITFYLEGKKQFSKEGKILFTHFGLSGPLILNSAGQVGELLKYGQVSALIDAFPDTDLGGLDIKIIKVFDKNKNKTLRNIFKDIVPAGTSKGIELLLPDINFETPVHSLSREDRKKIVNLLKALPVNITGLMGNDRAVSADGGVVLEEIDMKTMRSKKISNLYITGDLLHINRPSGGYSLQLCWTTGFIAGTES